MSGKDGHTSLATHRNRDFGDCGDQEPKDTLMNVEHRGHLSGEYNGW